MSQNIKPTIAVIGCGNMSVAMLGGLVGTDIDRTYHFMCSSRTLQSAKSLASLFQTAQVMTDNTKAVAEADKVILAIKPQQAESVCQEIQPFLSKHCHLISVMAGISTETLAKWCGVSKISRIMPNTPALIGLGMAGIYHSHNVSDENANFISMMMNKVGQSLVVDIEENMHAITAISGSGPAYFFHFIHHMQSTAEKLGFNSTEAKKLVTQTALGATQLVIESNESALTLQQKVCSPGGTTEQAIHSFEQANMQEIIEHAIEACYQKSIELSKSS